MTLFEFCSIIDNLYLQSKWLEMRQTKMSKQNNTIGQYRE